MRLSSITLLAFTSTTLADSDYLPANAVLAQYPLGADTQPAIGQKDGVEYMIIFNTTVLNLAYT